MNADERAAKAMGEAFRDAHFDPMAYEAIRRVMAGAIREAVAEEREACAKLAAGKPPNGYWADRHEDTGRAIAQAIRRRGS